MKEYIAEDAQDQFNEGSPSPEDQLNNLTKKFIQELKDFSASKEDLETAFKLIKEAFNK